MSWRTYPSTTESEDGYGWICRFLSKYDGDLLELELDVDSQHFFDNMDHLLTQHSPITLRPNDHRRSPLLLTPFVLGVISELEDSSARGEEQVAVPSPSMSFCEMLEDAQVAGKAEPNTRPPSHASTTPRKLRNGVFRHRATTARVGASINNYEKPTTRSSSRKKLNRRLFY